MTDGAEFPKLGDVWRFPYLWKREEQRGETEGRKNRPCVLALLTKSTEGQMEVILVPVTSQPQSKNPFAIEVPEIEKKRAGLDVNLRLWVIADEHNIDTPAQSYYFEAAGRLGSFSATFTKQVQSIKIAAIKAKKSLAVRRND